MPTFRRLTSGWSGDPKGGGRYCIGVTAAVLFTIKCGKMQQVLFGWRSLNGVDSLLFPSVRGLPTIESSYNTKNRCYVNPFSFRFDAKGKKRGVNYEQQCRTKETKVRYNDITTIPDCLLMLPPWLSGSI